MFEGLSARVKGVSYCIRCLEGSEGYDSRGVKGELYLAEEAVGLAKSLGWSIQYGPKGSSEELNDATSDQAGQDDSAPGRRFPSYKRSSRSIDGEQLSVGDRVEVPGTGLKGWYQPDGLQIDVDALGDSESDEDDEWTNSELRGRIAFSSVVRVRDEQKTTLFGAGKVRELGLFIADCKPSIIFVNHSLTALQQRKLEKCHIHRIWNDHLQHTSTAQISVVDRFGIILKIFAERARTKVARLQLEMAWIKYMKARLIRNDDDSFGGLSRLFSLPGKG